MATGGEECFAKEDRDVCNMCLKDAARYTCPRCNLRYCSSACYKGEAHSLCSEAFYKDCFMDGLKDMEAGPDEKRKMMEMLQRLEEQDAGLDEEEDSDEEDADVDLETRMKGLDLDRDSDIIWERLTKSEKDEFQNMLRDGRLGNMVEMWEPWWKVKRQSLVEEVGATSLVGHPPIKKDVPDISTILKNTSPSPDLPHILITVLYGYAYVARLHNGDHLAEAGQAAQDVQELLNGLTHANPTSVSEAIHGCMECLNKQESGLYVSQHYSVAVIEDVRSIVQSDHTSSPLTYMAAALSDLHKLLRQGRKALEKDLKDAKERNKTSEVNNLKELRQNCFVASKKVEFVLSWLMSHGREMQSHMLDIDLEFCALSSELSSHSRDKEKLEQHWGGKRPRKMTRLIEEVTDR